MIRKSILHEEYIHLLQRDEMKLTDFHSYARPLVKTDYGNKIYIGPNQNDGKLYLFISDGIHVYDRIELDNIKNELIKALKD